MLSVGSALVVHITPLPVFHIGNVTITNSILYGWITGILMIVFFAWAARKITVKPKGGIVQLIEAGVDFISNLVVSSFEDKERGYKYVPYFVTLFFFVLINNWLGILPLVGEPFTSHGNPLFRPMTGDWNATLAAGIVTMVFVYSSSVREAGFKDYFKHFFVGSPLNPLYLVIGLIEMLTDLTRVLSLSIRLFLNVSIGEIVISVFAYLGGFLAPITAVPFTALELFVGALQAYIFVVLSTTYLAIAVNHATAEHDLTDDTVPETIDMKPETA
jgi:F-type H+-transporting ATPase subunit a